MDIQSRFDDPGQFADIIVKGQTAQGGRLIRVKDVGRIELGSQTFSQLCNLNGRPAAGIAIYQTPDANSLQVARRLRRKWRTFPAVSRKTSDMTFRTTRRSFSALPSYVGSTYINQLLQVYAQADSQVRLQPDDLLNMNVSQDGNMVRRNARPSRPVLAGQYEGWILPLAVISAVPLALLGPVTTLTSLGADNNLYVQIGLTLLIALSAKKGILIVEVRVNTGSLMESQSLKRRLTRRAPGSGQSS